jgi:hypothetical protein
VVVGEGGVVVVVEDILLLLCTKIITMIYNIIIISISIRYNLII